MVFSGKGEGPVTSKSLKWDYRKLTINEGGGGEVGHNGKMRAHVPPLERFDC